MNLHALDIPEPEAIPQWLDRHLAGLNLPLLVAELTAVHAEAGRDGHGTTLDTALGDQLSAVLEQGLAAVGPEGCATLLRAPSCLLELQERVWVEGGRHWDDVAREVGGMDAVVDRGWEALERLVDEQRYGGPGGRTVVAESSVARSGSWRTAGVASLLTAAAMLVAMFAWQRLGPQPAPVTPSGWGWSRPGALAATATRSGYLDGLATSASDWFKKRPETSQDVATRILQFRQGCSTLILAEHAPLTDADRAWLRGRCRLWAEKLDAHVVALEAGADPIATRDAADETIRKLVGALRVRAETV